MPIITFIKDIVAKARGSYYYKVARHTQLYCQRAANQSSNNQQRRMLFVAAAAADETIASLLGIGPALEKAYRPRITSKFSKVKVLSVMKVYLSALLVLLGSHRDEILANTELDEQKLLTKWCSVYDYNINDKKIFNDTLLAAFKSGGFEGLAKSASSCIIDGLFSEDQQLQPDELIVFENSLAYDLAAILRNIRLTKAG
ncbi:hypothetical protein [Dendrosporobacter sp. 1207_IL3150]|uniref:hypothetical protein n=1 Tax=Dendrosporobacter sp. 1207_IL3150 TaxID=3084054 RepID=UPI002FD9EE6E